MKDDVTYLRHMLECIGRIHDNTAEGREKFMVSHTLQDAVLRNLQTMAESAQRLSDDSKSLRPEVEWKRIGAFRNLLVHDYLGIDLSVVWQIVQRDVSGLEEALLDILERRKNRP